MLSKQTVGLAVLLPCTLALFGCPKPTPGKDGGTDAGTDAGVIDAGTSFTLLRAYSGDGTQIVAQFEKGVDPTSVAVGDFTLTSDAGTVAQTITSAVADGGNVILTLSGTLPKGPGYLVSASGVDSAAGDHVKPTPVDLKGTLYLAQVWHQHQPVYIDPSGAWEWSRGPWVRKHATKDYYDMAAMLADYPDIHVQVNLTGVLLMQLQNYYIDRLAPFIDTGAVTVDTTGYFAQRGAATEPVTDPWLDMLLTPTPLPGDLTAQQKGWWYQDVWSNFSISDVMIARFPAYKALKDKAAATPAALTQQDLLDIKCWFQLGWFDPRFLRGTAPALPDGSHVDLSDLIGENADGTFTLKTTFTEAIAKRLVVEEFKVLENVVPAHRNLMYDATAKTGQIEVLTTPFYHPILPLIYDTNLALDAMPTTPMPSHRYQQPGDADVHVAKAVKLFTSLFGRAPTGFWPGEGSVAEAVVPTFVSHGIRWIGTDRRVLEKSTPANQPIYSPYRIDSDTVVGDGGNTTDEMAIVFRDTEISDKIGFHYQGRTPQDSVTDYMASLHKHAPSYGQERMLTIILDGENAWEWYSLDNDGIGFLNAMYTSLTDAQKTGDIRTVTVSEYLDGNAARSVPAHPIHGLPELEPLFAASWIAGSFSTWIGEDEENIAWDYLYDVRQALEGFGIPRPDPMADPPTKGTQAWYQYKAWESMYAAEGSDWFWWYGADQTASGGDAPFDKIYLALLEDVYRNAQLAGVAGVTVPDLPSILRVCNPPTKSPLSPLPVISGGFIPDDGNNPNVANEWTDAGSGVCQDVDTGTAPNPNDVIATQYRGITSDSLWLALRMNEDVSTRLGTSYEIRTYFSHRHILSVSPIDVQQDPKMTATRAGRPVSFSAGGAAYEVTLDFSSGSIVAKVANTGGSSWNAPAVDAGIQVAASGTVIEMKIPLASLHYQAADPTSLQTNDPLEMLITAVAAGTELDRAPNLNSIVVLNDRSLMVEITFILDATGSKLPLTAVKNIDNPPPPAGTGKAFIVGNRPDLGNWTPNQVQMYDDGTHGDETAGDNMWTYTIQASPGDNVQYKFTIGNAGQSWGPTEEYPMTNRGFDANDTNGNRRMIIRDVFANRPDPSGTLASMTEVLDP